MSDTPAVRAATSIAEAEIEERELATRVRAGDERAFERLMQRHWDGVFRYVQRLLERRDAAEDVTQEAFVRLWDWRASWRRRDTLRPVLYRIARNLALNERRRWAIFRRWASRHARPDRDGSPTPLEHAETRDLEAAAARAIESLPERRREIFLLVRFSQMSYREAAEVLGISPQTVANQMSQAMQQLRELLGDRLNEPSESPRSIAFPPARSG